MAHGSKTDPTFTSRSRSTREVVRRVAVYLRPYKLLALATVGCAVLSLAAGLAYPLLTKIIINNVVKQDRQDLLTLAALALLAAFFLREAFNSVRIRINNRLEQNVIFDMRRQVYARLQRLPVGWFDQRASGDLITRVIEDVNSVERLLIDGVEQGTVALLSIAGALVFMFLADPTLALVALVPLPFLVVGALWYTLTAHRRYHVQREAASAMNALLMDNLQGVRQIKAFGRQEHEDGRFAGRADDLREGTLVVMRAWAWYGPAMQCFGALGIGLVLWIGGRQVMQGRMDVGELVAFMLYAGMFFYEPVGRLHGLNQILQAARAAAARVFDILDAPAERPERRGVLPLPVRGEVVYENVSFSYASPASHPVGKTEISPDESPVEPLKLVGTRSTASQTSDPKDGDVGGTRPYRTRREILGDVSGRPGGGGPCDLETRPVLCDISLRAAPGEMIALVGPTGAGKSTLVNLLPAFYELNSGRILIDGRDTRAVSLESLRAHISVVSQEPFLFNGTIRENVLYGKLEATEDELLTASRAANCHEFISRLPHGYDTRVGERGVKLSVGEKQRVSIARALLKNSPILVLDEATASVDTATERLIQEALEHLMAGRTSFVIAHRLSTILKADQILVLRQGRVVERGTHQELLALNGLYARLARIQNTATIEENFEKLDVTA